MGFMDIIQMKEHGQHRQALRELEARLEKLEELFDFLLQQYEQLKESGKHSRE